MDRLPHEYEYSLNNLLQKKFPDRKVMEEKVTFLLTTFIMGRYCKLFSTGLLYYLHVTTNQACHPIVADGPLEIRLNDGLTLNDCFPDYYAD